MVMCKSAVESSLVSVSLGVRSRCEHATGGALKFGAFDAVAHSCLDHSGLAFVVHKRRAVARSGIADPTTTKVQ